MYSTDIVLIILTYTGVERINITPSVLGALLDSESNWLERSSLRNITLGGEQLAPTQITEVLRRLPLLEISSSYGPAEASVRSTYYVLDNATIEDRLARIPIGQALPNTEVYVVDEDNLPVPAGVIGEIIVSGIHLARGYLNRPDLTAERFSHTSPGSPLGSLRFYRTGDAGYWTVDGRLQFIGRLDNQLKIRGQRLEAGEVEAALENHSTVASSAVVVVPTPQGDQLIAYAQLNPGVSANEEGVVSLWEDRYDEEDPYGELDDNVAGHDFARWVSMFTGEPIPVEEMQEWLDDTITQLGPSSSDRVLELGVGTGKIALNIIDRVASFVGTDISSVCIRFLEEQIERRELSHTLSVFQGAAHEFEVLPPNSNFSLAIINSVAQYFPSAQYLTQVIAKLVDIVPQGRVFVGDVRSFPLIHCHDLERALAMLDAESSLLDVRETLRNYAAAQAELLLDPTFFLGLRDKFPQITHVEIKPKSMGARNELSRYRYNVTLHVGTRPQLSVPAAWIDCNNVTLPVSFIRRQLQQTTHAVLGAVNISIEDVRAIQSLYDAIHSPHSTGLQTVADVREKLYRDLSEVQTTPASLVQMAKEEGWGVVLDCAIQGGVQTSARAVFVRDPGSLSSALVGDFPSYTSSAPLHNALSVGNIDTSAIFRTIDEHLRRSLPSYMIPSRIIQVEALPLNRSGKLDRKLLSSPEYLKAHDTVTQTQDIGTMYVLILSISLLHPRSSE